MYIYLYIYTSICIFTQHEHVQILSHIHMYYLDNAAKYIYGHGSRHPLRQVVVVSTVYTYTHIHTHDANTPIADPHAAHMRPAPYLG